MRSSKSILENTVEKILFRGVRISILYDFIGNITIYPVARTIFKSPVVVGERITSLRVAGKAVTIANEPLFLTRTRVIKQFKKSGI